jgi:predicted dehydrogenase
MTDTSRSIPSRRDFLKAAGATAAIAMPANLAKGANESINVGLIGVGGRCRHLLGALKKVPGVKINAVCDVYGPTLDSARGLADVNAFATANYKALLDRKDVDAVLIATPDHWHVPITIDSCVAGKDVYVEKPLTHTLAEGRPVIEAQNKHQRIVQVGMQQRSMPHIQKGYELVKAGRLGSIRKVHLTWNRNADRARKGPLGVDANKLDWKSFLGNAPSQPFDEYRFRNWRWFWDFGGGIFTDLMVHWIDVAHWYLGADHPLQAIAMGQSVNSEGVWETPDTVQTILEYPNKVQVHFEGTFSNAREGAHIVFMGTEANLYIDRGRMESTPEISKKGKPEEMNLGGGRKGQDFYEKPDGELLHLTNWIQSIRSRTAPVATAEAGVSAASAAHLANAAMRNGCIVKWSNA